MAKLVEVVLLFGAVLAFGIWQLRSVDRDRRARLLREAAEARAAAAAAAGATEAVTAAAAQADPPATSGARVATPRDSD